MLDNVCVNEHANEVTKTTAHQDARQKEAGRHGCAICDDSEDVPHKEKWQQRAVREHLLLLEEDLYRLSFRIKEQRSKSVVLALLACVLPEYFLALQPL